jgi:aerobic carbon-monoxide dehydrogenase small subunit
VSGEPRLEMDVSFRVNGGDRQVHVEVRRTLADALRLDLGLTGTHLGCEHGVCGSCTVLLDGGPVRSCLVLAVQVEGHEVVTVEGLGTPDDLHPVQQGCLESHAFQCGFCTPGMLLSAVALLTENPDPDDAQIREALGGNLCRCTGYESIVAGVRRGAELARRPDQDDGAATDERDR